MFSAQPAEESSQLSGGIVSKIIAAFCHNFKSLSDDQQLDLQNTITHIVRKTAHFLEYFILGLIFNLFIITFKKYSYISSCGVSLLFCVLYAISDEIHQYFVPGRACKFKDVCIDTAGSTTAVLLIFVIIMHINRRKLGEINAKKEIN